MTSRSSTKTMELAFIVLGTAIALASLALGQIAGAIDGQWTATGIMIGGIMTMFGLVGLLRKDVPRGDERTRKLSGYATSWAWLAGITVTSLLYLLDYWGVIHLTVSGALASVLLTLLVTAVAFNAYYRSRGDME